MSSDHASIGFPPESMKLSQELTHVDLFAGCGGLSLGLKQAGFTLSLAVEKSDMAAETFYHNLVEHISSPETWCNFSSSDKTLSEQAQKRLIVKPLDEVLACDQLMEELASQNIDLVAGGPPCQGFSLAGSRKPDDDRNKLAWQFLDFVAAIKPKSIIIENVVGMRYAFKGGGPSSTFDQLKEELASIPPGYIVQPMILNAMHFGVPQHRPRVFLIGLRKDIAVAANVAEHTEIWQSEILDEPQSIESSALPPLAPEQEISDKSELVTVKDAISDLTKTNYSSSKETLSPYAVEMRTDQSWLLNSIKDGRTDNGLANHQIRRHCERVQNRFRLYQALSKQGIPLTVVSIPKLVGLNNRNKKKKISDLVKDINFPLVSPDRKILAECTEDLVKLIFELATKKHSQHPLKWTNPSHTVLSLPDDFVHPAQPRTMTVREMARFQSFPDAFEFRSRITTGGERRQKDVPQYTQVANAVPPKLAKAIGATIKKVLEVATKNMT